MTKKRVLIVEDDTLQNRFFEHVVSKVNAKSHLVTTGKDALKYLQVNNDIGLVLLDLSLPDMGGLKVLEELKKVGNKVPVAILSASKDSNDIIEASLLGAVDFFTKGKDDLMKLFEFIDETINSH